MTSRTSDAGTVTRELTAVVTQLRRALRRSIRTDFPWEARPPAQIEVLQALREAGPMRLGDLASRLSMAQSTMSALVTALHAASLVDRTADPRDRRAAVVRLTTLGRRHLGAWDAAHRRRLGRALRALSSDDRAQIASALPALGRLAEALNRDSADR